MICQEQTVVRERHGEKLDSNSAGRLMASAISSLSFFIDYKYGLPISKAL